MAKIINNALLILMDHEHFSTIERIFALSGMNEIIESVNDRSIVSHVYLNCPEGVDIHDYLRNSIDTMINWDLALSKVKDLNPNLSDEEAIDVARDMTNKFLAGMTFAKKEFHCLLNVGAIKPSKF